MIRTFQRTNVQNPDFDLFCADTIEALYNHNRDFAMKKLKSKCPEICDMFNDSSNAFYYGLIQGVKRFTQSEVEVLAPLK